MTLQVVDMDVWINRKQVHVGGVKNKHGLALSGIRKKVYKHTVDVQFLNRGHVLATYKFPNVEIPFVSSMNHWENLWFCDCFSCQNENNERIYSDDALLEAVLKKKKPIGYVGLKDGFLEKVKDVPHHIEHFEHGNWNRTELGVANHGTFGELFDLDALVKSYQLMEQKTNISILTDTMIDRIYRLRNEQVSEYLHAYDCANPRSDYEFMLTGLTLGFPLESTFALLTGNIK